LQVFSASFLQIVRIRICVHFGEISVLCVFPKNERNTPMRKETQFSIFLVNKPGVLAAVTEALAQAKVNLFALSLSDSGEHGVLRIVCGDAAKTRQVLNDTHDRWTETDVLVITLDNQPGQFGKTVAKLAKAKINVTYAYCTANETGGTTNAIFKVPDIDRAIKTLSK